MSFLDKAFDSKTYCYGSMESDHFMIHRGHFFTASQTTASLGASSWIDFTFKASTVYDIHLKQIDATVSGGLMEVFILEGSSTGTIELVSSGTTGMPFNRNRNSTIVSPISIFKNTTWGSSGYVTSTMVTNIISHFYIGTSGSASARLGGTESNNLEWILTGGTTYIVRLYNQGSAGAASLRMHYYFI